MKFPRIHVLFWIAFLAGMEIVMGQQVLMNDRKVVYPFRGELHYRLSWKGKGFDELKQDLPDSMVVYANEEGFHCRYFGGMSAALMSEIQWRYGDKKTYQVFHSLQTVFVSEPDEDTVKKKIRKGDAPQRFLGRTAWPWTLQWPDSLWKDEVWMWDSVRFFRPADSVMTTSLPVVFHPSLKGIPMKFVRTSPEGKAIAVICRFIPRKEEFPLPSLPEGYAQQAVPVRANQKHPLLQR